LHSITRPKQGRLDGIDLLRALAIFLVLMNHVNMRLRIAKIPYTDGLPDQLVSSLVWSGQFGVQIFFAVSGFLITSTSLQRWGSLPQLSIRRFYVLRFARIAPLLILLLIILSGLNFAKLDDFVVQQNTGGLGRALFAALTFHINVLEATRGYLPGNWDILWSLSVEETFYLFFPLIGRLLSPRLFIRILLVFVALGPFARTVLSQNNEVWREYSYLGGMDAIALGCLTALFAAGHPLSRTVLRTLGAAGVALLILSLAFSLRAYAWGLGRNGLNMTIIAAGTCLLMVAAAQTKWRAPGFLDPVLSLGKLSYEVYLTHMFVVFAFFNLFIQFGHPARAVPALFAATILVAAVLGYLVSRFYSEPFNRRLRAL